MMTMMNKSPHSKLNIENKAEVLLNNDEEWKQLMEYLRSSGVTTNYAARIQIINYLRNKTEEEKHVIKCEEETSSESFEGKTPQNITKWRKVLTKMGSKKNVLKSNVFLHKEPPKSISDIKSSAGDFIRKVKHNKFAKGA